MIDSMFQAGTDAALDDQVRRPAAPKPPAAPGFSFMDLVKSPGQGVGGAAANSIAFGAEITGAFGDVLGATGTAGAGGMFGGQTDKERADAEAARRKLLTQGASYSNEAGDIFRRRAAEIMPDPATTHTSAQVVAGLTQFGAQAIGYGLTLGPAAPIALAGDVGLTESDRLKQQGVDLATRTKAGAVAGAVAGASVVVPMTGATAVTRALKGAAVGEGSMAGQSAAERAILKSAGYDKLSDTFDPLDPVALGMGLVPGVLGAKFGGPKAKPSAEPPRSLAAMGLLERRALPHNDTRLDAYAVQSAQREGIPPEVLLAVKNAGEKSGSTATSPAGAQGVMQFMPGTWKEFGRGDPTDPVNSIDAGARYLRKLHDSYGDWDAALAHYNGGSAQAAIVRSGGAPTAPETAAYLKRVNAYLGKTVDDHVAAAVDDQPDLVPAARVGQAAAALEASRLTAADDLPGRDAHVLAVETAADQLGRGEPVRVDKILQIDPHEPSFSVYHGTNVEFSAYDPERGGGMVHFAETPRDAQRYAEGGGGGRAELGSSEKLIFRDDGTAYEWRGSELVPIGTWSDGVLQNELAVTRYRKGENRPGSLTESEVSRLEQDGRAWAVPKNARVNQHTLTGARIIDTTTQQGLAEIAAMTPTNGLMQRLVEAAKRDVSKADTGQFSTNFWSVTKGARTNRDSIKQGIVKALKDAGYDGIRFSDDQHKTIALFDSGLAKLDTTHGSSPTDPLPRLAAALQEVRNASDQPAPRGTAETTKLEAGPGATTTRQAPNPETLAPARGTGEALPAAGVPEPGAAPGAAQAAGVDRAPQAMLDRAAAEVSMLNPDMLVQLDGMDAPVRVGDLLERVKREAAEDAADARLVEVAAACALRA